MMQLQRIPAKIPAVFDMPISMPATAGAMSMHDTVQMRTC